MAADPTTDPEGGDPVGAGEPAVPGEPVGAREPVGAGAAAADPEAAGADPEAAGDDPVTGGDPEAAEAAADAAAAEATPVEEALIEEDAAAVDVEADLDELGAATRARDEYLDALRRLQADFENYRKRVERQQAELADRASERLVVELLPVLDTADLALAHGAGEGVKQIWDALSEALERQGLERIDAAGAPFDPTVHDAVAHEPGDGGGAQEVAAVLRAGYRWKGRVVRPAMVNVRG